LKSRILALLVLTFFFSGCTQLSTIPASSNTAGESENVTVADINSAQDGTTEDMASSPDEDIASEELAEEIFGLEAEEAIAEQSDGDNLVSAFETEVSMDQSQTEQESVRALCREIGNKLGSVSVEDCLAQPLKFAGGYTVQSRPIVIRDFYPEGQEDSSDGPRILIMGGIHGDEYSSISIMFKWMEMLDQVEETDFRWRFAPTVNPDGLLDGQAIRQNANGVDLNRNFPSDDWFDLAQDYWTTTTNRNPRRFPGTYPASEPEVQWIVEQIHNFKPDVIVSVHAPYHLLDYDGPSDPPQRIGELHLHLLGVYPGSLGNYAGLDLGLPVVTMELPSAGIMPTDEQIISMWQDLQDWLHKNHDS